MTSAQRRSSDRLAVCQAEGGGDYVGLDPGEQVRSCVYAECDCKPRVYVALDTVAAWVDERSGSALANWIRREFEAEGA